MSKRKLKVSSTMSLDDKVRVIDAYHNLSNYTQREQFKKCHKLVENILLNESKILEQHSLMLTKLDAVKNVFNLHTSISTLDACTKTKITLLEKVIFEWCQRFQNHNSVGTFIQERVAIALGILNITSFTPSEPWMWAIRQACKAKPKYSLENMPLSLSIKEITRYVLEQEGISKEKAQSKYGIYVYDEEWPCGTKADNQEQVFNPSIYVDDSSSEPCEIINIDDSESSDGSVAATSDTDRVELYQLVEDNTDTLEYLNRGGNAAASATHSKDDYQLMEDDENGLEHFKYDGVAATSANERMEDYQPVEDNKEAMEYIKNDGYAATSTENSTDHKQHIKNNQDALERLKPLRNFLGSQNNLIGLKLLEQIEAILIEPEKKNELLKHT